MKSRLHHLEIRNFKAFRKFSLDLEGRHMLVYGPNGSGKSSLYWALYTFLQSARKPTPEVAKYFDPANPQNLLNIHESPAGNPGEIAVTLRETATKNELTCRINLTTHGTMGQPEIIKADLASDFITYRFLFGFSHFRNSEQFDIWRLFEREILPFCVTTGGLVPIECWNAIKADEEVYRAGLDAGFDPSPEEYERKIEIFAGLLPGIIDPISKMTQEFYDKHFAAGETPKVTIKLGLARAPELNGVTGECIPPVLEFGIQLDGKTIPKPQVLLNEAKMTQLGLSVRFAASLVNLHESSIKLLVLDDLLLSLDMSNRMKVLEILFSEAFVDYQKIILTHEHGFFLEIRRKIGASHPDWSFLRLEGTSSTSIECRTEKSDIQQAEDYLHGHNLDEAAIYLRKAVEGTARRYLSRNSVVYPIKEFKSLTANLREARNRILGELQIHVYERVLRSTPQEHRELLVSANDADIEQNVAIDLRTKNLLKNQRSRLRRILSSQHVELLKKIDLIDEILACAARVLNPAAHAGTPPLYEKEIQDAVALIKQLEISLAP